MKNSRFMQFASLFNSAQGSINRMKRQNMEAFDLGPAHTVCLNILYEQPEGTTKTNLAKLCGVDKAQISRVVSELQEKELPAETVARAKAVAEADYYKSRQSRAARAGEGASLILNGRSLDHAMRKLEEMKAVDAAQMRAAARVYLDPARVYEVRVTP